MRRNVSDSDRRRPALLPWVPAAVWMAVIFGASALPGSAIPGGFSVFGHLGEYAVLGVLLYLPARRTRPWLAAALVALVVASVYGASDELHQTLSPGRMPDPVDWVTDTVGAAFGVGCAMVVTRRPGRNGPRSTDVRTG